MRALLCAAATSVVIAGPAMAAEWNTQVSGYYHLGAAFSDNSAQDGVGVLRDGEFHINAELVTDTGLKFFARIEVEAQTDGDQIDKNYGGVETRFGTFKFGGDDTAIATYHNGVISSPGSKIGYYNADPITLAGDDMGAVAGGEQGVGFHYDTPEFNGFQAGFSYVPSLSADGAGDSNNPVFEGGDEFWSVAAAYNGEFQGFGFGISGGYADESGPNNDVWNVGGYASASGFTLAGGYQDAGSAYTDGASAGETFYVGAMYETGPWMIGAGYSNNDFNDTDVAAGWVTYRLAPGVMATGGIEYADDSTQEDIGGIVYMSLLF